MQNINSLFFSKLYSSISTENIDETNEIEKKCLISNEPLIDGYITLECKHSFNYEELYHEITRQKTSVNKMEIQRLRPNQIKCPYCRHIQTGLLPYYRDYPKVMYVNHPVKYQMCPNKCSYTFKSGKRKGQPCSKPCHYAYCVTCDKKIQKQKMKQKAKQAKQAKQHTNQVISVNTLVKCPHILQTGSRKGEPCNRKAKYDGKCGFHKSS